MIFELLITIKKETKQNKRNKTITKDTKQKQKTQNKTKDTK
jgi:hypothetical protein